jgi:hypothetical protein
MLLNILIAIAVLLLGVIAYQQVAIQAVHRAMNQYIAKVLAPRRYSFVDGLHSPSSEAPTVIDQLGRLLAESDLRLAQIEGALGYLRNYTWEIHDPRHLDDVKRPKPSTM